LPCNIYGQGEEEASLRRLRQMILAYISFRLPTHEAFDAVDAVIMPSR
jgi:hypothetical protein